MTLSEKVSQIFDQKNIINKSLARYSSDFSRLPLYVADYIINQFVDPNDIAPGLQKAQRLIENHYVNSDHRDKIKAAIRKNGKHHFIGNLSVRYDQSKDQFWSTIDVLGDSKVRIAPRVLSQYSDVLLVRGCYGKICVSFDPTCSIGKNLLPFLITEFVPLQIIDINLDDWISKRSEFSESEWIDLLINSLGFNPDKLDENTKIFYLCRMIPFVENNVNLVEFGPTETGKTFAYRSLSNYGFVISGSNVTVASLFYNKLRRKMGLIGYNDVVMFDEISGVQFNNQADLINILKDYMNSGNFGRDQQNFTSTCSIVFAGNIECDRESKEVCNYNNHLFTPFPTSIRYDKAFLDRLHGFLPGWLAHQISTSMLSHEIGFMSDYMAEIFHSIRERDYAYIVRENIRFYRMGHRNENAIIKLSSGLLKLIYPDVTIRAIEKHQLKFVVDIAIDLRQRVIDQISIISPQEFQKVSLKDQLRLEI